MGKNYKSIVSEAMNGNKEAREELYEIYKPKVLEIVQEFIDSGIEYEDLLQLGYLGLLELINKALETGKPVNIKRDLRNYINSNLNFYINKNNNLEDEQFSKEIYEKEICMFDQLYKDMFFEYISDSISNLKDREKFVIEHYYGLNGVEQLSSKEISKILSVTTGRINEIRNTALRKLKHRNYRHAEDFGYSNSSDSYINNKSIFGKYQHEEKTLDMIKVDYRKCDYIYTDLISIVNNFNDSVYKIVEYINPTLNMNNSVYDLISQVLFRLIINPDINFSNPIKINIVDKEAIYDESTKELSISCKINVLPTIYDVELKFFR